MKLGIALPNFGKYADKDFITEVSQKAEKLGYASLWASDHVVIPESHKSGFGNVFYDALVVLSYVSAITNKISLGTSVLILPYRNPLVLAKMISTLDRLSGGRMIIGIGAGWLEDEFRALGAGFKERGQMTNDYIEIMKALWTEDSPEHDSRYFKFSGIGFLPKPQQHPHPPLWVGGGSPEAMARAVRQGDGWHPVGMTPGELKNRLGQLDKMLEDGGRDRQGFTVSLRRTLEITDKRHIPDEDTLRGSLDKIKRGITEYEDAGADHIIFQILSGSKKGVLETMETVSKFIPSME